MAKNITTKAGYYQKILDYIKKMDNLRQDQADYIAISKDRGCQ